MADERIVRPRARVPPGRRHIVNRAQHLGRDRVRSVRHVRRGCGIVDDEGARAFDVGTAETLANGLRESQALTHAGALQFRTEPAESTA